MKTFVITILLNSSDDARLLTSGFDSTFSTFIYLATLFKVAKYTNLFSPNTLWCLVIGHIFANLKTPVRRYAAWDNYLNFS